MTDVICDWCGVHFNKTPAKIKKDRHHFHENECRLKYQRAFGCQMKKPDHSVYKRLCSAGAKYRMGHHMNHQRGPWDSYNGKL